MSYRVGDRVYWTKEKVTLPQGEALLTDGRSLIRARCGNCISDTPQGPTSDAEPDAVEFDRAIAPAPGVLHTAGGAPEAAFAVVPAFPPVGPTTEPPLFGLVSIEAPVAALHPGGAAGLAGPPTSGRTIPGGIAPHQSAGTGGSPPVSAMNSAGPLTPGTSGILPPGGPLVPPDGSDPPQTFVPPVGPPGPARAPAVPEPGLLLLVGAGVGAYALRRRR
jgi:hypothetical protein